MASVLMWIPWARVARDQAARAEAARTRFLELQGHPDTSLRSAALGDEMEASIVSISASVFASEAVVRSLTGRVIDEATRKVWRDTRRFPARDRLRAVLRASLTLSDLPDELADEWQPLITYRNNAVHPDDELRDLEPHPSGLTNVAAEAAVYSAEKALAGVALLIRTLEALRDHPAPNAAYLSGSASSLVDELQCR